MKIGKNNDLIKRLTEKGYVLRFETDKYYLNNNDILFSSNEEREKVYRMIEKMCLNREIIPPPFDKNRLDKIKYKFPLLKLEEQLNKRCSEFKMETYMNIFSNVLILLKNNHLKILMMSLVLFCKYDKYLPE